jgi:hypothetical protein
MFTLSVQPAAKPDIFRSVLPVFVPLAAPLRVRVLEVLDYPPTPKASTASTPCLPKNYLKFIK